MIQKIADVEFGIPETPTPLDSANVDNGDTPTKLKMLTNFWPLLPYRRQFFSAIRRQIWQIFDPSPLKECQHLKWTVSNQLLNVDYLYTEL